MVFTLTLLKLDSLFALRADMFSLELSILQMFSDYQMQEMAENFIDSFGFHDDEFTESDENVRL